MCHWAQIMDEIPLSVDMEALEYRILTQSPLQPFIKRRSTGMNLRVSAGLGRADNLRYCQVPRGCYGGLGTTL